jgi:hypothetical protein
MAKDPDASPAAETRNSDAAGETSQDAQSSPKKRQYTRHGAITLRKALVNVRTVDQRTRLGKELTAWRAELVQDLGGEEQLSAAALALVDVAARSRLILEAVDGFILTEAANGGLIRDGALIPLVRDRTTMAESMARQLDRLGLERRARDVPSLGEYLRAKNGK